MQEMTLTDLQEHKMLGAGEKGPCGHTQVKLEHVDIDIERF